MMKTWLKRHNQLILIAALLIGAGLRWLQIGTHNFWYDEAVSALIARLRVVQILTNVALDDHPPGYYLLLHFWLTLGESEVMIRSLSALFSLATIPLVYGLGRCLFDRATSALAALGMALCPFQIYYAQETRFYGVVIFLSAALIWIFLYGVTAKSTWWVWLGYSFIAILALHFHYFVAFLIVGLHLWLIFNWRQSSSVIWRLLLVDGLIVIMFLPQLGQALSRTKIYLTSASWQPLPTILSPLTTIYYLLFGHRTPLWVFPVSLFLTLTLLLLTFWEGRWRSKSERQLEQALWLCVLTPIVIVMLISWLVRPIYLERSFAVGSPALVLLLACGVIRAPRRSPTPYLAALLFIPVMITLGMNLITPDPAKPPAGEVAKVVASDFSSGDVSLHLQDASYMPAIWYTPEIPHLLTDVPGALVTTVQTHQVFGGDVVEWQTAVIGADRLWLTVMPGYNNPEQEAVHQAIETTYPQLMVKDWGEIQLYLYDLRGVK